MRARGRSAGVVCALVLLAAGCGGGGGDGGEGGKVTITFANWAIVEEATTPGLEEAIAEFERTHPNIDVRTEGISFTDIEHQVLLEARSGNAPDVAEMAGNYTLGLAEANILQPLDDYADAEFSQSIIPAELDLGRVDGELVAIPWTVAPFGLWYNRTLLAEAGLDPEDPPQTMQQLESALADVKANVPGVIPLGIDTTNRSIGLDANWSWMRAFGAEPFTSSQATANTPQMREYLSFMRTLATEDYTEINKKAGDFRPLAAQDKIAFAWDGPYFQGHVSTLGEMSQDEFLEKWGVMSLPTGGSGETYSVPTDHQLVMLNSTEHPQESWEFMNWLATSDWAVQNFTLEYEYSLPPLAEPSGDVAGALETPTTQVFLDDVVPNVIRPPWGETYSQVYSPVMASVQSAMTSSTPIDQVANEMQTQVESGMR